MILVKQGFALLLLWKALKTHFGWRVFLFQKFFSQSSKGIVIMNKQSNFIGQYFRQYINQVRFDRKVLIKRLGFDYADNDKAICDYLNKKDYLWRACEVEDWCKALSISPSAPIYDKLVAKAGK